MREPFLLAPSKHWALLVGAVRKKPDLHIDRPPTSLAYS
jgi:hypothetical protein